MANSIFLPLGLTFLFFFHISIAQLELPQQQYWQNLHNQQQHRLQAKTRCRIQQLNAREPNRKIESEAGSTEFWDSNSAEFECAGVEFVRHTIQPKGLLLPYYTNTPQLVYIIQGSGIQGTVIPGCAETYESESSSEQGQTRRGDRHQKLRRFRRGDVLALPQGVTLWAYNDGDTPIVSVSILDVANQNNQLDLNYRKFFLAGSPRRSEQEQRNIFNGFDEEILAQSFNVDPQIIRKLQSNKGNRGTIVRAENLHLVLPEYSRQEQEREREQEEREREGGRGGEREREQEEQEREREQEEREGEGGRGGEYNGLEETFCSLKIRQNIDHPSRSDVYNPRGGRISSLNSQSLPILSYLQLSAERGVLYKNAIRAPHWNINSHSVIYVTRGSARVQVVGNHGKSVFNDKVSEGQLLIVPQNYVVIKKASDQGFEWVSFKTNDNAMSSQLAGRLSAIRAFPEEVLINAYDISRQDARNLKYNREEATLFSPGARSKGEAWA